MATPKNLLNACSIGITHEGISSDRSIKNWSIIKNVKKLFIPFNRCRDLVGAHVIFITIISLRLLATYDLYEVPYVRLLWWSKPQNMSLI